jgi:ribosomal protein S14
MTSRTFHLEHIERNPKRGYDRCDILDKKSHANLIMAKCFVCGKSSILVSKALNVCHECIRNEPAKAIEEAHSVSRSPFGFPPKPPDDPIGV